jgi:O-methyltransferase involved in polyketide biosynthesis
MKNIFPPHVSGLLAWTRVLPTAIALLLAGVAAHAHHSFAVFFDADRTVSVRGTVVDFQFRNPHGLIRIKTTDKDGKESVWKAETNSPSILERRGWARDTLKAGEVITMDGWPARDGSNYLRLRTVKRADGTLVGKPLASSDEQ